MSRQEQFLEVVDRDVAETRFQAALRLEPVGEERVPLAAALSRVLAQDIPATVDVPSFDRSNYDGFAVQAADTYGATEHTPRQLALKAEQLATGVIPTIEITAGTAVSIATGGMVPRGADAIVMVEHADLDRDRLIVRKAVTPGFGIAFAGSDIAIGETVLRRGDLLSSRATGVLAAIGQAEVPVYRRPKVAILSTGDEVIAPGQPMQPALVYDSNARILADAVRELGGEPWEMGIVADHVDSLRAKLNEALAEADVVLLSGGTSKGQGDLSYQVVAELDDPGILAHGVALKPGKPICLAASGGKPVVILPGFPTSAIFTFHEFVAPVIRTLGARPTETTDTVPAQLAVRVNSEIGRTEYLLVSLVAGANDERLIAYPLGKGSGSVTTFSRADGFVTIDRHQELLAADAPVDVRLIGREVRLADLVIVGSHCVGLDYLVSQIEQRGYVVKLLAVGSTAGLKAAERGDCDLAGIHLLDPKTETYNRPFITPDVELAAGYGRRQGVLYRPDDPRFAKHDAAEVIAAVANDMQTVMINRNQGSGTRLLIDTLLNGRQPPGYSVQARNHSAVAVAIAQGRADWGIAIENVARAAGLEFLPVQDEQFDLVTPVARRSRPAVQAFLKLLVEPKIRETLGEMGFQLD